MPDADSSRWWTKPYAIWLSISTGVAVIAGFLTNIQTIESALGIKPALSIKFNRELVTSQPDIIDPDGSKSKYDIFIPYTKVGDAPVKQCKLDIWVDRNAAIIRSPSEPFDVPAGKFEQGITVTFELPTEHYYRGTIALTCSSVGAPSASFTFGNLL